MPMNRREFLQGLGLSAAALAMPTRTRISTEEPLREFLYFEGPGTASHQTLTRCRTPQDVLMYAFGADLVAGRTYDVEIDFRSHAQILALGTPVEPGNVLIDVPGQFMGQVDLSYFFYDQFSARPVSVGFRAYHDEPFVMECQALRDVQMTIVMYLALIVAP